MNAERAALIELLYLQELQASYSRRKQRRDCAIRREPAAVAEASAMKAELDRRLPVAWAAARATIAKPPVRVCPSCSLPPIGNCAFANCKREFAAVATCTRTAT